MPRRLIAPFCSLRSSGILIVHRTETNPDISEIKAHEQVVTPWDVQGSVTEDGKQSAIDYDKLIVQFGTKRIDDALLERFEKVTGHKPHPLVRRGMFFSHR